MVCRPVGGLPGRGAALSGRVVEEPGDVLLELGGREELRVVALRAAPTPVTEDSVVRTNFGF